MHKIKEYIFVTQYFYLDAITNINDDEVKVFSLTIRDGTFNPIFNSYPSITLGKSVFKDIVSSGNPLFISGCVGAHDYDYHEIYYLGLPGNYEQVGFGLNESGYIANKYDDFIPSLSKVQLCLSLTNKGPTSTPDTSVAPYRNPYTEQDLQNFNRYEENNHQYLCCFGFKYIY